MTWFKWRYFLYLIVVGLWVIWFINLLVGYSSNDIAIDCDKSIDSYPVGIVLGARVIGADKVSDVYADRLQTAVNIYKQGKITKILISGDHGQTNYDEVNAGREYLLKEGVRPADIFLDHAGFDTYDSVYRAKNIFNINQALIITQEFHLPRALYLSKSIGMETLGCKADLHKYKDISSMQRREVFARIKAWLNVVCRASSKYLGEKYDITGDGQKTWDQFSY